LEGFIDAGIAGWKGWVEGGWGLETGGGILWDAGDALRILIENPRHYKEQEKANSVAFSDDDAQEGGGNLKIADTLACFSLCIMADFLNFFYKSMIRKIQNNRLG